MSSDTWQKKRRCFSCTLKNNIAYKNTLEMRCLLRLVDNPIKVLESEHEAAGDLMASISKLSGSYTPPADACSTYKVLYSELKEFEADLHMHVHLENNILFPKASELEVKLNKTYSTL
jgi:iron-sulfur cluster repair protein YtfE (RIC family)